MVLIDQDFLWILIIHYSVGMEDEKDVTKLLKDFYIEGLGIKCVIEEPWVTLAESSEAVIALLKSGEKEAAHKIFSDIIKLKNKDGIFPYGISI